MHPIRSRRQGGLRRRPEPPGLQAPLQPPPGCDPDSVVLQFPVPRDLAGMRLDRFIQRRIPRLSRTRAQQIIRNCAFRADGARRRSSDIVRAGEVVLLVRQRFKEPEVPLHFEVLFDDGAVLAVDKPAGLPMHPTATYHKHTLSYLLRERYGQAGEIVPRIAHRLDRETSGIVLCGRTPDDERGLKMAFEAHRVEKSYLAIVHGEMSDECGEIAVPMRPVDEGLHVMMEVRPDGHSAHTQYRVLERRAGYSLVELSPRTGRQHQLRVHLRHLGHPIVGDKLYGPDGEAAFIEHIEQGLTQALLERLLHSRQALHAASIRFAHPRTGQATHLRAPFAADLQALWQRLTSSPFQEGLQAS